MQKYLIQRRHLQNIKSKMKELKVPLRLAGFESTEDKTWFDLAIFSKCTQSPPNVIISSKTNLADDHHLILFFARIAPCVLLRRVMRGGEMSQKGLMKPRPNNVDSFQNCF